MAINKLKIVISILKEISESNTPTENDYDLTSEEFFDIIDAMQDDGLIKGVRFARGRGNRVLTAFIDDAKITIKGMEYLDENSALVKTYKGLKELRDWLPF